MYRFTSILIASLVLMSSLTGCHHFKKKHAFMQPSSPFEVGYALSDHVGGRAAYDPVRSVLF